MINGLKPKKLLYRDGTGQSQRSREALSPDYVGVDERNMGDLLRFAQDYARELIFFNDDNQPAGNWEGFLMDDIASYQNGTPDQQAAQRKAWIAELLRYLDQPDKGGSKPEQGRKFSRPHLALFMAFLQLLGYIKAQLNGFTKKHLDFYYFEVLGLRKKKPLPDVVHVILEIAGDLNAFLVAQGTLLFAGRDRLDKDLVYKTNQDIVVSQARVARLQTLFVEKKITDIAAAIRAVKEARQQSQANAATQITRLFQLALGDPGPGDPLPRYKSQALDLAALQADLISPEAERQQQALAYLSAALLLTPKDFELILATFEKDQAQDQDWEQVATLLDRAYKEKIKRRGQQTLKQAREGGATPGAGFYLMWQLALGDPAPGDALPLYNGAAADLDRLYLDLTQGEAGAKKEAVAYIREELLLTENDFKFILETYRNSKNRQAMETDWAQVYATLELTARKKSKSPLPAPSLEAWLNVYSVKDAQANAFSLAGEEGEGNLRFHTFGQGDTRQGAGNASPATIGFAVSSPQLVLQEGSRIITLTISFQPDQALKEEEIAPVFSGQAPRPPFLFFLSNSQGWRSLPATSLAYGHFIVSDPEEAVPQATRTDKRITRTDAGRFDKQDIGRFLVWDDGSLYAIQSLLDDKTVEVLPAGAVANKAAGIAIYPAAGIYFHALQVVLALGETDPPVNAPGEANDEIGIKSAAPVLAMLINNREAPNRYQAFKDLKLNRVKVKVEARNLQAIALQNDFSVLSYKKPFEVFGYLPETGNRLNFGHPELCAKQLETLTLQLAWVKPPEKFSDYYHTYWLMISTRPDLQQNQVEIQKNTDFTADLSLVENNTRIPLLPLSLFRDDDARKDKVIGVQVASLLARNARAFRYDPTAAPGPEEDVINWKRYFSLELGKLDFQHQIYPALLTVQALLPPVAASATDKTLVPHPLRDLTLNLPYTPKLKAFTASYTAAFEIDVSGGMADPENKIYHIQAFGYRELAIPQAPDADPGTFFLPRFLYQGELYIGLAHLAVPQTLSLLFQLAAGSADPDLPPMPITWSYLADDGWQDFTGTQVLSDATQGLLNTGIITFDIPAAAASHHTGMEQGLHWLRAAISSHAAAIPDTVAVFAQAIEATFADHENAPEHLQQLLPAGRIRKTVLAIPQIKSVSQPYTSSKGTPPEGDLLFYNRVSERLRHKNRALTMWDYERLVLEQFPGIYKVKCIPGAFSGSPGEGGRVEVIVIPDIKGKLPFNPFQPKNPANTIQEIQQYLEGRVPAFATVKVKNPSYLQVKTRFAVKIKAGYNAAFYAARLEAELKRYLAPWAYQEGADLVLGGKIYASVLVNFIAERPYVDYVAGMKLFQSEDGNQFIDVRTLNAGENFVQAAKPDVILVSALEHEIDLITDKGFEEEDFSGIDYMRIGLDFKVG